MDNYVSRMDDGRKFIVIDENFYEIIDKKIYQIPAQTLHRFWRTPTPDNIPKTYIRSGKRSDKLVAVFDKFCSKEDSILELGCNVGRNLNYLYNAGYKNGSGVDINSQAIQLSRETFKNLANQSIVCSSIEDHMVDMGANSYDVIFTMAVLMHIHPTSDWIFSNMVNSAKKYIITCEEEEGAGERVFPRNYKEIFEGFGMKQVFEEYIEYGSVEEIGAILDREQKLKIQYRVFKK